MAREWRQQAALLAHRDTRDSDKNFAADAFSIVRGGGQAGQAAINVWVRMPAAPLIPRGHRACVPVALPCSTLIMPMRCSAVLTWGGRHITVMNNKIT